MLSALRTRTSFSSGSPLFSAWKRSAISALLWMSFGYCAFSDAKVPGGKRDIMSSSPDWYSLRSALPSSTGR